MTLRSLPQTFAYALLALVVLGAAVLLQTADLETVGHAGLILLFWLLSVLLAGVSLRNSLLFCALFFLRPTQPGFVAVLLILAFSLMLEYLQTGRKVLLTPHPLALAILIATAVYGLIRARSFADAWDYFLTTAIVPWLLLLIAANSRIRLPGFLSWLRLIVGVGTLLGGVGIVMGVLNPAERYGSLWFDAMTINGFYLLAFFFAIALGIREGAETKRWLWFACAFVILMGMLYTYTRVTLVGVAFGFFLMMLKMKRMRYVGMGALLLLPLIIPSSMVSRIELGLTFDFSIYIRLLAWYYTLQQIYLHPFFGIGISVWQKWYAAVVPMDFLYAEHSHNLFLKIWLELGVFGFLSYFYLIWAVLRRYYVNQVRRSSDNFHLTILIGALALLVACLTDIFIQQFSISLTFWTTLAFMYALSRIDTGSEEA